MYVGLERQYKVFNFGLKAEIRSSLKQTSQIPRMCSPAIAQLHKKGPHHRRNICVNSLWLYSYFTQTSPSKNKDINYILKYLRVLLCLSSGTVCERETISILRIVSVIFLGKIIKTQAIIHLRNIKVKKCRKIMRKMLSTDKAILILKKGSFSDVKIPEICV